MKNKILRNFNLTGLERICKPFELFSYQIMLLATDKIKKDRNWSGVVYICQIIKYIYQLLITKLTKFIPAARKYKVGIIC